jgi:hypothetical protein
MGEYPVRIQAKLVMPRPPRCRHRAGLLDDQRIKAGPANRPRRSKPCRPRSDHHNTLIHAASVAAADTARQPLTAGVIQAQPNAAARSNIFCRAEVFDVDRIERRSPGSARMWASPTTALAAA